jgi:hypothetical protein
MWLHAEQASFKMTREQYQDKLDSVAQLVNVLGQTDKVCVAQRSSSSKCSLLIPATGGHRRSCSSFLVQVLVAVAVVQWQLLCCCCSCVSQHPLGTANYSIGHFRTIGTILHSPCPSVSVHAPAGAGIPEGPCEEHEGSTQAASGGHCHQHPPRPGQGTDQRVVWVRLRLSSSKVGLCTCGSVASASGSADGWERQCATEKRGRER